MQNTSPLQNTLYRIHHLWFSSSSPSQSLGLCTPSRQVLRWQAPSVSLPYAARLPQMQTPVLPLRVGSSCCVRLQWPYFWTH